MCLRLLPKWIAKWKTIAPDNSTLTLCLLFYWPDKQHSDSPWVCVFLSMCRPSTGVCAFVEWSMCLHDLQLKFVPDRYHQSWCWCHCFGLNVLKTLFSGSQHLNAVILCIRVDKPTRQKLQMHYPNFTRTELNELRISAKTKWQSVTNYLLFFEYKVCHSQCVGPIGHRMSVTV